MDILILLICLAVIAAIIYLNRFFIINYIAMIAFTKARIHAGAVLQEEIENFESNDREDVICRLQDIMWGHVKLLARDAIPSRDEFIINLIIILNCATLLFNIAHRDDDKIHIKTNDL